MDKNGGTGPLIVDPEALGSSALTLSLSVDQLQDLVTRLFGSDLPSSPARFGPPPAAARADSASHNFPSEEEWESAFSSKEARDRFLMELDRRRGKQAALLPGAYSSMSSAMKAFLDQCHETDDAMSAMRISNMANTFHECQRLRTPSLSSAQDSGSETGTGESAGKGTSCEVHRLYLQCDPKIRDHAIWKKEGFWASALKESVLAELQRSPPVRWHEMPHEELRESVIAVHNIIFGQLGSLSFVMQQLGLSNEVVSYVLLSLHGTGGRNRHQTLPI